ncbi:potassium-transporting ATPase subunit KdpC [Cytobacillus sp. Hz8]|uniref:potassium-transporting ATPase subunit KdpC n=1 Tax=Cytobacillus sp. Hz8 TaxID=3347168 RepID=UPI0035DA81E0
MRSISIALRASILLMILCGLVYPLATTGVAQVLFHKQAEGSLVSINGNIQGSELLAQDFTDPGLFHQRASAANYDPKASAGSNVAIASNKYMKEMTDNVNQIKKENENIGDTVPADLVTSSGSGFDPDLSPEAAKAQVPRIATAIGLSQNQLISLINKHTKGRALGIFGEPRVNVLELNMALQQLK